MNPKRSSANRGMLLAGCALTAVALAACGQTAAKGAANAEALRPAAAGTMDPAAMITAHNQWRSKTGVPELVWSDKLADVAQKWADHLAGTTCSPGHSGNCYGENLFMASPRIGSDGSCTLQKKTAQDVVNAWCSELQQYDYSDNSCHNVCGHYTQVVWKDTREVGCAVAICGDKSQIWVCNYEPAGNMIGKKPY